MRGVKESKNRVRSGGYAVQRARGRPNIGGMKIFKKLSELRTSTLFLLAAFFILLPKVVINYQGATGRLMVAEPHVGQVFRETVLYVEHHTLGSATAFIVNMPLKPEELNFEPPAEWQGIPLYYGGPVGYPNVVFYMYREGQDRLVFSGSKRENPPDGIMLGYAGWTVMQLNYEIARGHWSVIDHDPALVFDSEPSLVWDKARRRVMEKTPVRERKIL